MKIAIRPEAEADHVAIHDLTKRAFAPMPFADGDEQDLIPVLLKTDTRPLAGSD